ncbi:hypothetical protein GCM10020000_84530 [Streptomyces olivoverticillatus]
MTIEDLRPDFGIAARIGPAGRQGADPVSPREVCRTPPRLRAAALSQKTTVARAGHGELVYGHVEDGAPAGGGLGPSGVVVELRPPALDDQAEYLRTPDLRGGSARGWAVRPIVLKFRRGKRG